MPDKLDRCVKKVQKQGKNKESAYAICSKSTGYKKAKGGGWEKMKESTDKVFIQEFLRLMCEKEYNKASVALASAVEAKLKQKIKGLR